MISLKKASLAAVGVLVATGLTTAAWAESAAERAVKEAQKYKGQTITIVWEAGLQSLDPLNFSGPLWEKLTGMKVKVIEVQTAEMFTKIMQEFRAGTGAYDALNVIPSWMPDLVQAGALEPLDAMVDKYAFRDELQKIAPTYRDNQMKVNGKIYVIGGYAASNTSRPGWLPIDNNWEYDPATDTYRAMAPIPGPRCSAVAEAVNGKVYLIGRSDRPSR